MNIEEVFAIARQSSMILYEMIKIVNNIISKVNASWRISYVTINMKNLLHKLNIIIEFGKYDHPRNYLRAQYQFEQFPVVVHVCNPECNLMIGINNAYSHNCLYIALICMKDSFEFIVDDWEATSGNCGRQIHSGIEYYYVCALHLKHVIERLIN